MGHLVLLQRVDEVTRECVEFVFGDLHTGVRAFHVAPRVLQRATAIRADEFDEQFFEPRHAGRIQLELAIAEKIDLLVRGCCPDEIVDDGFNRLLPTEAIPQGLLDAANVVLDLIECRPESERAVGRSFFFRFGESARHRFRQFRLVVEQRNDGRERALIQSVAAFVVARVVQFDAAGYGFKHELAHTLIEVGSAQWVRRRGREAD